MFGFGNWGAELASPIDYREFSRTDKRSGEISLLGVYSAIVRVHVRGAEPRSDVGSGFVTEHTAEEHDTAIKTAVTDGLKRTLRHFGDAFGNSLYDRASSARAVAARELTDLRATVLILGELLQLDEVSTRRHVAKKAGQSFNNLAAADLACVLRAMAGALNKRRHAA